MTQVTAEYLRDCVSREAEQYVTDLGLDTDIAFEFTRNLVRENDLVVKYNQLGEDGFGDWVSDKLFEYFGM